jgi:hypothetical protein
VPELPPSVTPLEGVSVPILDVRTGDLIDLEADPYADPRHDDEDFADHLVTVLGTQAHADGSVTVRFTDERSFTFPDGHELSGWGHDDDLD